MILIFLNDFNLIFTEIFSAVSLDSATSDKSDPQILQTTNFGFRISCKTIHLCINWSHFVCEAPDFSPDPYPKPGKPKGGFNSSDPQRSLPQSWPDLEAYKQQVNKELRRTRRESS